MQQTFALINGLLARDAAAARRRLRIATYRVVPFSPRAGLLQWVEDTQPLNSYLLGRNYPEGAHSRYAGPGYHESRERQGAGRQGEKVKDCAAADKLPSFLSALAHFSPVLHHYFLEGFPSPTAWLAAQGRFLATPELVPFRLTRDVVDGMGINGTEGPFRRSCEETLRVAAVAAAAVAAAVAAAAAAEAAEPSALSPVASVLRTNSEALLTVIDVVTHDPLHKWTMTLAKARKKQQAPRRLDAAAGGGGGGARADEEGDAGDDAGAQQQQLGNADAARVVLRVKQKLEGRMDVVGLGSGGAAGSGGAEGAAAAGAMHVPAPSLLQVRALLAEAQDPARWCRMYPGWSAWM
eukprot:XP_001693670.1 serine/threonine-protein kinase ATM [Chlamydomonas reinhardtii]